MGRKRKYQTEQERIQARRASARKSYHNRKQVKPIDDEFNRLLAMNPDLYTSKKRLTDEQKQFIKSLMNLPIDLRFNIKRITRYYDSRAKQQLGLAASKIRNKHKTPIKSIDFDITLLKSEQERQYFYEHFPDVINNLLDSINFNTEHWTVYYEYDSSWKTRTLDDITEQYMRDQVKHDLQEHLHDYIEYERDYDFFPVMIQQLTRIRFINIDNASTTPQGLRTLGTKNPRTKSTYRKHEGKFWRWLLKGFPELNLERFMIFAKLDKQSVELIQRDNCFVYACRQADLDDALINNLRYSIHKRSMTHQDLTNIAKEDKFNLKIHIREPNRSYYINPSGNIELKLVLLHNHYMIDDTVNCSPYYILHRKEINYDRVARYWKREDKMRIIGKSNGYYQKGSTQFSLIEVIKALFEVNAFEPITMNDYRAYASIVCFENIDPIKSLNYDPQLCCRLKQDTSLEN